MQWLQKLFGQDMNKLGLDSNIADIGQKSIFEGCKPNCLCLISFAFQVHSSLHCHPLFLLGGNKYVLRAPTYRSTKVQLISDTYGHNGGGPHSADILALLEISDFLSIIPYFAYLKVSF